MIISVIIAVILTYTLISIFPEYRNIIVLSTAAFFIILGQLTGVFPFEDALLSISLPILMLMTSMEVFTLIFSKANLFQFLAIKIIQLSKTQTNLFILLMLCLTFLTSCVLNNLTTIFILVPITIYGSKYLKFDPKPIIIAQVIVSNPGGASTLIGDFPNMLIAGYANIDFIAFIKNMMPATILFAVVIILDTVWRQRKQSDVTRQEIDSSKLISFMNDKLKNTAFDKKTITIGLIVFVLMIISFIFSKDINLPPEAIAFASAMLFLVLSPKPKEILNELKTDNIFFFAALFVIVNMVAATGVLTIIVNDLVELFGSNKYLISLSVMYVAAFFTAFFSAGPTTATFLPIAMQLDSIVPNNNIWWALSLGVCAGSSATLIAATAGPIATSLCEKYCDDHQSISFVEFLKVGLKNGLIFLLIATVYMLIIL